MGEAKRRRELGLKPEDRPTPTPVPPRRAWRPLQLQLGGKTYELHVDGKIYERGRGRVTDPTMINEVLGALAIQREYRRLRLDAGTQGWLVPKWEPKVEQMPTWIEYWRKLEQREASSEEPMPEAPAGAATP